MISQGVVRDFRAEVGWGVVDGPDVPGGCWVHFSAIVMGGYRQLTPGQRVSFHAEVADHSEVAWSVMSRRTGNARVSTAGGIQTIRRGRHDF